MKAASPPIGAPNRSVSKPRRTRRSAAPARKHYLQSESSRKTAEIFAMLMAAQYMRVIELDNTGTADLTQANLISLVEEECPTVLRGYAASWECTRKWKIEGYLKEAAGHS